LILSPGYIILMDSSVQFL